MLVTAGQAVAQILVAAIKLMSGVALNNKNKHLRTAHRDDETPKRHNFVIHVTILKQQISADLFFYSV